MVSLLEDNRCAGKMFSYLMKGIYSMKIPRATYRLQFNRDFTFRQAQKILGYLSDLGISDIYASPIFKAVQGSAHGYDAIDFHGINSEIG